MFAFKRRPFPFFPGWVWSGGDTHAHACNASECPHACTHVCNQMTGDVESVWRWCFKMLASRAVGGSQVSKRTGRLISLNRKTIQLVTIAKDERWISVHTFVRFITLTVLFSICGHHSDSFLDFHATFIDESNCSLIPKDCKIIKKMCIKV